MRRFYRMLGLAFLGLAAVNVFLTWFGIWRAHRKEVDRLRMVWGPDADVPSFNPLKFFDPSGIPLEVSGGYIIALALSISGVLLLFLSRSPKVSGK